MAVIVLVVIVLAVIVLAVIVLVVIVLAVIVLAIIVQAIIVLAVLVLAVITSALTVSFVTEATHACLCYRGLIFTYKLYQKHCKLRVCAISGESYQCAFYGGARDTGVLECAREC